MKNSIIDIKFLNGESYLLKNNQMSLSDFESQISEIKYKSFYESYRSQKDEGGAEKAHFPAINIVFYKSIFETGHVLSPQELINNYFDYYGENISVNDGYVFYASHSYPYATVAGRILRTYPSLIRDFDFYLRLTESKLFDKVIYSCKMDIEGTDIIIKHHGKEYKVSLFVETSRSKRFKEIKNKYRHDYGNNEIQVPLKLSSAKRCGDFFIYDDSYVEQIKQSISQADFQSCYL